MYSRYLLLLLCCGLTGCFKDFLEKKPDEKMVIPVGAQSLQALLDNTTFMNESMPMMGEISADQYLLTDVTWENLVTPWQRNAYVWASDLYEGYRLDQSKDWPFAYRMALYANIALEGAADKKGKDWDNIRGGALFFRSLAFYNLLQQYAPPYKKETAPITPGIPLKLEAGIDEPVARATLKASYQQVLTDLELAVPQLPVQMLTPYRPFRATAWALLAKTNLVMGNFEQAARFADSTLKYAHTLLNYANISSTPSYPFARANAEVIFHAAAQVNQMLQTPRRLVDTEMLDKYESTDLRRTLFFKYSGTTATFRGSYYNTGQLFCGITTGELFLIRAECRARMGQASLALADLDTLRKNRFAPQDFHPLISTDPTTALRWVLEERERELLYRCNRWSDLRRLNSDPEFAISLQRIVKGTTYTLSPEDSRYTLPIPPEIIELNNLEQLPR